VNRNITEIDRYDIVNLDKPKRARRGWTCICDFCGKNIGPGEEYYNVWVKGTQIMLRCCKECSERYVEEYWKKLTGGR
jgi:hypothetical protein